jgi:hypothetical protein
VRRQLAREGVTVTQLELELEHDTFNRNTRNQLRRVFDALRELAKKVTPAEPPQTPKRPIGFLTLDSNSYKPKGTKAAKALKVGARKRT